MSTPIGTKIANIVSLDNARKRQREENRNTAYDITGLNSSPEKEIELPDDAVASSSDDDVYIAPRATHAVHAVAGDDDEEDDDLSVASVSRRLFFENPVLAIPSSEVLAMYSTFWNSYYAI
jgi:hypothetical protein